MAVIDNLTPENSSQQPKANILVIGDSMLIKIKYLLEQSYHRQSVHVECIGGAGVRDLSDLISRLIGKQWLSIAAQIVSSMEQEHQQKKTSVN